MKLSDAAIELWNSDKSKLEYLIKTGQAPTREEIYGFEFMGLNTGLVTQLIRRVKFIKYFYMNRFLMGNNFKVKQNEPKDEYIKILKNGLAVPEGYFLVRRLSNSILLDYDISDNAWYQPARFLRDYLVKPFKDNPNILLGKAYLALGPFKIPVSFFVLERYSRERNESK